MGRRNTRNKKTAKADYRVETDVMEDSLYKPAPVTDKPSEGTDEGKIRIERIRRDDRGHVLTQEPVRMPRENLYYNSEGYIPQENINYSRRESFAAPFEEKGEPGDSFAQPAQLQEETEQAYEESSEAYAESLNSYEENSEAYPEPGSSYEENTEVYNEPGSSYEENPEAYTESGNSYDGIGEAYDDPGNSYDDPDEGFDAYWQESPYEQPDHAGSRQEDVTEPKEEEKNGNDVFDKYYGDSWVTKFVPPEKEAEPAGPPFYKRPSFIIAAAAGIILAIIVGGFVALLDLEKNGSDLIGVINGSYKEEQRQEFLDELRLADASSSDAVIEGISTEPQDTGVSEASEDTESNDEEGDESEASEAIAVEREDMDISGLKIIVDAGSGDEITFAKQDTAAESEVPAVFEVPDPNAGYPLPFKEVDYGYFLDSLFIGDSRLQGFGMYADLPATYYCVTSFSLYKYDTMKVVQTDEGKVPIFDALPYDMYTKIYIKVGLNELGGDENIFLQKYAELIAKLREYEPRAIIYVHAILPVTASKSATDKVHNNEAINARNEKLRQFAEDQKAYYIDVNSAVALEDGTLPPESTADGIHLKASAMGPWKEYLRTHAVVVK